MKERWFHTYIMANKPFGTIYIGVTGNLPNRIYQHKEGAGSAFVRKYKLHKLVYFETFSDPRSAIQREKTMKRWPREWKLNAINARNPDWDDLYLTERLW